MGAAIHTKRWNDPIDPSGDGLRVLVFRYRPRGVSKADQTWDRWLPQLGPSKELHAAWYGKDRAAPLSWPAYRAEYLRQMRAQTPLIADLASQIVDGQTITLLCSSACVRPNRCHRTLLKALIEKQIGASRGTTISGGEET